MLRLIRIVGLIAFAFLMSYSANTLYRMYKSGTLFEQYNSQRKSNITLFAASALAVIVISGYEIRRFRKSYDIYSEYRPRHRSSDRHPPSDARTTSCIYASRESVDTLPNRSTPGFLTEQEKPRSSRGEIWMKVLRIVCLVIPFVNLVIFAVLYLQNLGKPEGLWLFPALCSVFVLVGVLAAVGIFNRRKWGLSTGYLLAIINLILFPVGTAMALLLLISLVGASSVFPRRRKIRI